LGNWNATETLGAVQAKLTVRVFGMDKHGRPFSEHVAIVEIRSSGARVAGLKAALVTGDTIGVQLGEHKARFRVVSAGQAGTADAGLAELEAVQVADDFWGISRPSPSPAVKVQVAAGDRRKHPRYVTSGTASIRKQGSTESFETMITDLSLGGCYIQTFAPLPIGTSVVVQARVDEQVFGASGVIRTCHPGMGMGVEFSGPARAGLLAVLERLGEAARIASVDEPSFSAKADSPYTASLVQSVSKDLQDLAQLLQCTEVEPDSLRRFRDLLGEVRNTAWAMERYLQSHGGKTSASAQLEFLTSERVRLATKLCQALTSDANVASADTKELHELASAVGDLIAASIKLPAGGGR
jgi:hypothetical protein